MKKLFLSLLVSVICAQMLCAQDSKFVNATDPNILVEGRQIVDGNKLRFIYPGTAFTIRFSGTQCSVWLKPSAGYFVKSVDGAAYQRFDTYNGSTDEFTEISLAQNLTKGEHSVKIMLVSEGIFCNPVIKGFAVDKDAKILKPVHKKLKIEFIGNSITCGYGVESNDPNDHYADSTGNFAKSFAGLTAKTLDAEATVVARSGIGVYRNFNDNPAGSEWPMPRVYENALISDSTVQWTFADSKPDVVVICLGTNDLSTKGYDKEKFTVAYIAFVKTVRKHYPAAKIVLCNSPMLHDEDGQVLNDVIMNTVTTMYRQNDSRVYRFDFQEQDDSLGYGADYHPSAKRHSENARYLSYFIQTSVLGKKK